MNPDRWLETGCWADVYDDVVDYEEKEEEEEEEKMRCKPARPTLIRARPWAMPRHELRS